MSFADPALTPIDDFAGARDATAPTERLREVRRRATRFRDKMLAAPRVTHYRSTELVRFPYPASYGFCNALSVPTPYVHLVNRMFIVQFEAPGGIKTLLVSPSDVHANAETPNFKRMLERFGPARGLVEPLISRRGPSVASVLAQAGVMPSDVDYITYDHLHTQDLRGWIGEGGLFPRAKLLVMRQEWESALGLLPPQREWYCPHGLDDIDPARVVLLEGDTMLGESVALLATSGHTEGNHSIVCRTDEGLMVTSENGIGPDAYAPERSKVPGLAAYARATGMECVLNGNTLERGLDQYISMVAEKTIAGPSERDPRFPNMVCSSEVAAHWLFPGIRPTFGFGDLSFGTRA